MKKIFIYTFIFSFLFGTCKKKEAESIISTEKYYVFTTNNLHLRAQPNANSESLALLPRGTELKVLEKTNETLTVDGITSNWWKVEAKGKTGYLFSGYVSRYSPSKKECHSLMGYLTELYGELNENNPNVKNYKKTEKPCDHIQNAEACGRDETFKIEPFGIEVSQKIGYEWGEEEVFFPNMQDIEGFLLLRDCCHQENKFITYTQYKNMLEKGVPIPEFQEIFYLTCKVKRKGNGLVLETASGL